MRFLCTRACIIANRETPRARGASKLRSTARSRCDTGTIITPFDAVVRPEPPRKDRKRPAFPARRSFLQTIIRKSHTLYVVCTHTTQETKEQRVRERKTIVMEGWEECDIAEIKQFETISDAFGNEYNSADAISFEQNSSILAVEIGRRYVPWKSVSKIFENITFVILISWMLGRGPAKTWRFLSKLLSILFFFKNKVLFVMVLLSTRPFQRKSLLHFIFLLLTWLF